MMKDGAWMTTDDARLPAPTASDAEPERLPARLEPMMLAHLAVTGDTKQYRQWRDRIEEVRHHQAIVDAPDTECREILREKEAWLQVRTIGHLGASFGLGLGFMWMSVFLPLFAAQQGLAWWQLLPMFLPIPVAWKVGAGLWEDASLAGMRDVGKRPTMKRRLRALAKSLVRGFGAGFGFGFTLVFLQGLMTYIFGLNPAPTLLAELASDAYVGTIAGAVSGTFGMLLAPMVARGAPSVEEGEPERALGPGSSD